MGRLDRLWVAFSPGFERLVIGWPVGVTVEQGGGLLELHRVLGLLIGLHEYGLQNRLSCLSTLVHHTCD